MVKKFDFLEETPFKMFGLGGIQGQFGIELEIEGKRLPHEVTGWILKAENSLRNGGIEYITRGAIKLEHINRMIDRLNTAAAKNGAEMETSDRCSTHLHINMINETFNTILNYILVFTLLEPILLRLCGPSRNGNLFCIPSYETGDLPETLRMSVVALRSGVINWFHRGKYSCLNIDGLNTLGSLETRCFTLPVSKGLVDSAQVYTWATWLDRMLKISRSLDVKNYKTVLQCPEDIAYRVFNGTNLFTGCQPENVAQLLGLGVETTYECARMINEGISETPKTKSVKIKTWEEPEDGVW